MTDFIDFSKVYRIEAIPSRDSEELARKGLGTFPGITQTVTATWDDKLKKFANTGFDENAPDVLRLPADKRKETQERIIAKREELETLIGIPGYLKPTSEAWLSELCITEIEVGQDLKIRVNGHTNELRPAENYKETGYRIKFVSILISISQLASAEPMYTLSPGLIQRPTPNKPPWVPAGHPLLKLRRVTLADLAARLAGLAGLVAIVGHPVQSGGRRYNAASVIENGRIVACYHKHTLPNYTVFDEQRYFDAGDAPCVFALDGVRLGINICEDTWGLRNSIWSSRMRRLVRIRYSALLGT